MKAEPPPLPLVQAASWHVGAFESDSGVHGVCGYELGSHRAIENHGAGVSSNQCETSWPGRASVGAASGSRPRVIVQFTLLPEPGALDRNSRRARRGRCRGRCRRTGRPRCWRCPRRDTADVGAVERPQGLLHRAEPVAVELTLRGRGIAGGRRVGRHRHAAGPGDAEQQRDHAHCPQQDPRSCSVHVQSCPHPVCSRRIPVGIATKCSYSCLPSRAMGCDRSYESVSFLLIIRLT